MPGTVRFIVDTNLFHECHSLVRSDFPWHAIGDFDVIELVVPEPVQAELDRQKKDTRARLRRRAVEAVSWFRELLQQDLDEKVLRESNPRVILRMDVTLPSSAHPGVLDNSVTDDRIVGVAVALAEAEPTVDVRLLTHDTRPAAKARAIRLRYVLVPEEWIREPEQDELQKENQRLQEENERLRAASPDLNQRGRGSRKCRDAASDGACGAYQRRGERPGASLTERFSLVKLESKQRAQLSDLSSLFAEHSSRRHYIPPSEEEIEYYRTVTYPTWVDSCIHQLQAVPRALNLSTPAQSLNIVLLNDGSRPAENVLIHFVGRGSLFIAPPPHKERPAPRLPEIPPLPAFPQGHWVRDGKPIADGTIIQPSLPDILSGLSRTHMAFHREDEAFYYEPNRPDAPVEAFSLTCRRLRHGLGPKLFEIEIFPQENKSEVRGAIEVQVSASNVSDLQKLIVPIKVLSDFGAALEAAQRILDAVDFLERPGRRSPFSSQLDS